MSSLILKYANSHIYDIYALLSGTLAFIVVMLVKRPIKQMNRRRAEQYMDRLPSTRSEEERNKKQKIYYRRSNLLVIILAFLIAAIIFAGCAYFSPQIGLRAGSLMMSGVFAVAEYAIVEQMLY